MQIPNSGTSVSASPVGAAHLYAQREEPAANFINTGRDPIILYNYFYDAQCGQVGFQPNRGLVERSGAWRPKEFADARQESDERASLVHHAAFAVHRYGLDKREPWPKRHRRSVAPWVGSCVEAALYRRGYETEPSLEEGDSSVMATRPHRNYSKRPYANLWRYETALSRSWSGTLHELQRLQAKRAWRAGPDNNRGGRRHQYKRERRATDPE